MTRYNAVVLTVLLGHSASIVDSFLSPASPSTKMYKRDCSSYSGGLKRSRQENSFERKGVILQAYGSDDNEDDEDMSGALNDRDWRAFRAKLVMSETDSERDPERLAFEALDPDIWAYDTGKVIEKGVIILGGVEQDFGFGLRQQYFHKAVMLVLDHEPNKFTRGIILNRPSSKVLLDEDGKGNISQWRVWFGGDVQGFDSMTPEIVCIHSLQKEEVISKSATVMKDIQWTTFDNAKSLVADGYAKPSDFWAFCGYAGWGPNQLAEELDRKSWYMVATDSNTLLQEMQRQAFDQNVRNAGLDTWTNLMEMIGKEEIASKTFDSFDDLMLKEWARENLLSDVEKSSYDSKIRSTFAPSTQELNHKDPIDKVIEQAQATARGDYLGPGTLVRASSAERSPFLLSKQEFHKSIILIISDDENLTAGVILNRPATKGVDLHIADKKLGTKRIVTIPLRYGGEYTVRGQNPLLWLHCNKNLRDSGVGTPMCVSRGGIWSCRPEEVSNCIAEGLAKPEDFMAVSGISVWTKGEKGLARGIEGEVRVGNFEIVPQRKSQTVFDMLLSQEVLSETNISSNLQISNEAWAIGVEEKNSQEQESQYGNFVLDQNGDEYQEDDSRVFKSKVKLSQLSDDALKSWIAAFLLGQPSLE
mmetsp:Transcript_27123/g.42151  ORF Transcript_27123/g.42151 Transcript_27123/m.42151 type:complete len:645 (+) Transcript_27123:63-1997(+)|eukprot:CAMPEP_0196813322 /NCGR_PEP_ID=MMETSP1362-20130617/35712_1 /TAXON_ID=163516 /ORGANISM="Leptocylindrus danicus, Strain CCMP1856" /LENGTH=644 /DNA_ID=CAMNT_0042189483 /DNA_START=32 /DNA_END=1966 /DNA_ORIENTATION=-